MSKTTVFQQGVTAIYRILPVDAIVGSLIFVVKETANIFPCVFRFQRHNPLLTQHTDLNDWLQNEFTEYSYQIVGTKEILKYAWSPLKTDGKYPISNIQ